MAQYSPIKFLLLFIFLQLIFIIKIQSQDLVNDSIKVNKDISGPQSVEKLISSDNSIVDIREFSFLKDYYDFKKSFSKKSSVSYGIDYSPAFIYSSSTLPAMDEYASSGIIRFYGSWKIKQRKTNSSTLIWRVSHHHAYSSTVPANFALSNLGVVSSIDPIHDDKKAKLNNLYFRQDWKNGAFSILGGFYDPFDLHEVYALTDPLKHFSNLLFLTGAGTMSIPSSGSFGLMGSAWVGDHFYIQLGITGSNGDPTDPLGSLTSFFEKTEYYKHLEIGYTTSQNNVFLDNIHLTLWHTDKKKTEVGDLIPAGYGMLFSYSQYLGKKFLPFLKVGLSKNGSGSLMEKSLSVGLGYQPKPIESDMGNLWGVAYNLGNTNDILFGVNNSNQSTFELFYRMQITRSLALSPDLQFIINPALNPNVKSLWILGLRTRFVI